MKAFFVVYIILAICALVPSGLFQLPPSTQPCTTQGSFEIVDGTCQNYYICVYNGATLQAYSVMCASPTLFNPIVRSCSAGYVCTQPVTTSSTTTSTTPTPTTPTPTTPTPTTPTPTTPTPTTPTPTTPTPTTPTPTTPTPTTPTPTTPTPTTPTPTTTSTTTPTPTTTITPTPTTAPSTTTTAFPCPAISPSVCPRNGRFSLGDPTCKQYRVCYTFADIVINRNMTCPNELIFNCFKEKCVRPADYVCPPTKLS